MRTLKSLSLHLILLAAVADPLLAACGDNIKPGGDDIDGGGDDIDASDIDAMTDAGEAATHSATIAVFDTSLNDPSAAGIGGVRGGTIRMSFSDLTEGGGEEIFRGASMAPIQSCLVTRFDPTHLPNPRLDAGPITVSAPEAGASALLKTVGPCTLQAPFGEPDPYVCISHNATGVTVTAVDQNNAADLVAYVFPPGPTFGNAAVVSAVRASDVTTITTAAAHGFAVGDLVTISAVTTTSFNATGTAIVAVPSTTTFTYANDGTPDSETGTVDPTQARATVPSRVPALVGSALSVNGFTNTDFNSGAGAFPIIVHNPAAPNILVARNTPPSANENVLGATGITYSVINGFTPIPTFGVSNPDFLGGSAAPGATSSIRIQKAADADWPALDFTVDVPGQARAPVTLTNVTRATNVVTATTAVAHEFIVGQVITVAGVPEVVSTLTTAAGATNTVTVVATAHGLVVGDTITVAGITGGTPSFNGNFTVATAPDANTFTYALTGATGAGTGGTATKTSFNGSQTVVAVPTTTTFTYAQTASNRTATGGTAVKPGGFDLDAGSSSLIAFPTTAADQNYSCDNDTSVGATAAADDTCGDESTTPLKAFIVSGSASKKSVGSLLPFQMPTEVPGVDTWVEWQCAYIAGKSGDFPSAAVAAILGETPTRIEQQVLFVAGFLIDGPGTVNMGTGRILAGHALAGHTTLCPAAGAPPPAATITAIARATNVVTVTTSAPHNFMQGQTVTIAGVTDTSFNSTTGIIATTGSINGAVVQFTFAQAGTDVSSTGGTASVQVAHSGLGGPVCAACNDGIDNDGDGMIDLLDTAGCANAADTSELP